MQRLLQPFRAAYLLMRWRSRRDDGRSVRVRVSDPARLLRELDDAGARNAVMRWFDDVPDAAGSKDFVGDVDVLVDDHAARAAAWRAAGMPGRATVEFRSVTGRMGSYGGMPYLPPAFAEEVLAKRVRHARGYPIPAPKHRLPLVMFHLCYHKAEASGIPTGVDLPTGTGKSDYAAKLRALAAAEGAALPEPLTLASMHDELARRQWDLQLDLLARWPVRTPWINFLERRERERYERTAAVVPEVIVFILRDDVPPELRAVAHARLAEWFDVLDEGQLDDAQRARCTRHLRGGNWSARGDAETALPSAYVVVNDPRPKPVTDPKVRERQPHLTNNRVGVKHVLRRQLREAAGDSGQCRSAVHSSDNRHEAMHFLEVLYAERLDEKVRRFAARIAELKANPSKAGVGPRAATNVTSADRA